MPIGEKRNGESKESGRIHEPKRKRGFPASDGIFDTCQTPEMLKPSMKLHEN